MIRKLSDSIARNRGFTLPELLIVIAIVGLLAATVLFAMQGAQENAKVEKTRSQIKRINSLIAQKWEELANTRVRMPNFGGQVSAMKLAQFRVDAMRELQRMSLPDRKTDVTYGLYVNQSNAMLDRFGGLTTEPSIWRTYQRKAQQLVQAHRFSNNVNWIDEWTPAWEQSECLYLILSQIVDEDTVALEYFSEDEIGDIDNDGMPEIHDAWGNPILFIRWAPGFNVPQTDASSYTAQNFGYQDNELSIFKSLEVPGSRQKPEDPDPSDPLKIYTRQPYGWPVYKNQNLPGSPTHRTFNLFPVILSAGPDKTYDIDTGQIIYADPVASGLPTNFPPNNPFVYTFDYTVKNAAAIGSRRDDTPQDAPNGNGRDDFSDDIHNHVISTSR